MLKKSVATILAAIMLLMALSACGSSSSPERTTQRFFNAVKAGDLDTATECFTPSMQAQFEAALSLSNSLFSLFGVDTDTGALLGGLVGATNVDAYQDYDFKVAGSTKTDDTHAAVTVDVYIDGNKNSSTTIYCVKIDDTWYIEY